MIAFCSSGFNKKSLKPVVWIPENCSYFFLYISRTSELIMSSVDDTVPLVVLRLGCESVAEAVVTGKE